MWLGFLPGQMPHDLLFEFLPRHRASLVHPGCTIEFLPFRLLKRRTFNDLCVCSNSLNLAMAFLQNL